MRFILLLSIFTAVLSASVFSLTNEEKRMIKESPKKRFIVTRFVRFNKFLKDARKFDTHKKLVRTNAYLNQIISSNDIVQEGMGDIWLTPKEFLIEGTGDCEDYAISKYFTLLELGIPREKLYLSVSKVKRNGSFHMNLLYLETPNSIPLVMDNLSWKVASLDKRTDLEPLFAFNELRSYNFNGHKLNVRIKIDWGDINKWEELLHKIYTLNK